MKTKKYYLGKDWFYYRINNTKHGLHNLNNVYIGYSYKNKEKGFWLDKSKI
jgi:hypothetical protein